MSNYRKRSTKRKKRKEATLVGDLFKILFAVSMLIVAILVAFFVFKNVSGFKLPDLRVTTAETEESETPVVVNIGTSENALAETSAQPSPTESAEASQEAATGAEGEDIDQKIESVEASIEESIKASSEEESKKESSEEAGKESKEEKDNQEKATKESDKVEEHPSSKDTEKPGPMPEKGNQGEISEGPVVGTDTIKENPVTVQKDGSVISEDGPVAG